jgi:geranyl-CoA carboxylase alpha subunit
MKRILIANRGEIARRVIATAHAMGIETVAVYADSDAQALHVREATCAFALGGQTSAQSYLRVDRLLEAARATGADAVHPGYGFLSEDANFAQAVVDAGWVWIGPPPSAIRALGSKSAAKALAAQQGVPCLPGYAGTDQSEARFEKEAQAIGYPLMVKAVAGGGGRGMRLVTQSGQLAAALSSARSEALAGFGNGDLLIERALLNPRHVEVQIFADAQGHCIHLGERDCSVQRRHQKIIEESPSPAVNEALRSRMGTCAVALAQAAGYVGAGTVEFLLDGDDFFLMEMNTRLQVEHPVTEALTGLDLVEWQIRIARGEALPLMQDAVCFTGHAIEVRLCSEDAHFTPHTGEVLCFEAPPASAFTPAGANGVRFDHAIETGLHVTPHFDAMLGKLIVHAPTRQEAIARMVQALAQTVLLGLPSNRAFLAACLQHPVFVAGAAHIPFLDEYAPGLRRGLDQAVNDLPAALAWAVMSPGQALTNGLPCPYVRPVRLQRLGETATLNVREAGHGQWQVQTLLGSVEATQHMLTVRSRGTQALEACLDGVTHRLHRVALSAQRWHVQVAGVDWWLDDASMQAVQRAGAGAGSQELRAPFNGRVVALVAAVGQTLAAGQAAVILESMKLEHSLSSPQVVTVAEVLVSAGQQVAPGQVLLRFAAAAAPSQEKQND